MKEKLLLTQPGINEATFNAKNCLLPKFWILGRRKSWSPSFNKRFVKGKFFLRDCFSLRKRSAQEKAVVNTVSGSKKINNLILFFFFLLLGYKMNKPRNLKEKKKGKILRCRRRRLNCLYFIVSNRFSLIGLGSLLDPRKNNSLLFSPLLHNRLSLCLFGPKIRFFHLSLSSWAKIFFLLV